MSYVLVNPTWAPAIYTLICHKSFGAAKGSLLIRKLDLMYIVYYDPWRKSHMAGRADMYFIEWNAIYKKCFQKWLLAVDTENWYAVWHGDPGSSVRGLTSRNGVSHYLSLSF